MTNTPAPKHVFMSYSRRDEAVMRRVAGFLRKQGINVWVDNEKLVPGTPIWEEEIEKAIINAGAVIILLSPDSKKSPWVRREISYAERYHKRIFPVMVAGDEDSSITLRLSVSQYVDIQENEEIGLNSLHIALSFYLENLEAREQREEAERLAREKAEREAAEKAAREKVEREAAEKTVKEKAERKAAERAQQERNERKRLEREEKARKEKEVTEKAAREKVEREIAEKAAAHKVEEERLAREQAKREVIEPNSRAQKSKSTIWLVVFSLTYWVVVGITGSRIWTSSPPSEERASMIIIGAVSGCLFSTVMILTWQRKQFNSNWLRLALVTAWTVGMALIWGISEEGVRKIV